MQKARASLPTADPGVDNLSDEWIILGITNIEIKLKDDSNSSIEELHFLRY